LQATGTLSAAQRYLAAATRAVITLGEAGALAIVYFLTAQLGLFLLAQPSDVAVFWPASGFAAGFLILSGRRAYSALVIGVVIGTTAANLLGDRNLFTSILKGFCNAGEAILVAWLLARWFGPAFGFGDLRRVFGFFAAAGLAAAASGVGGAATMTMFHTTAPFREVWRAWFLSDGVGIVVVAPFVVALGQLWRESPRRDELIEGAAVLGLLVLTSLYIVSRPTTSWVSYSPGALVLPMLLWLAARAPPTLTIAGAFVVSSAAICATIFGLGRFGDAAMPIVERVKGTQVAATMVTAYTLVLAALFTERRQSDIALKTALDGAKLGAFSAHLATGRFECDLRTARMHGHNVLPPTIKESRRFVHRDDLTRIDAALANACGNGDVWNAEYRVMHPPDHPHAGETRWVAVESSVVCDSQGIPKLLLGVTRDITQQRQAEQALAERNMQLSLAGKSAWVGSYAYDPGIDVMQVDAGYAALHGLPDGTVATTRSEWRARAHPEDLVRLEKMQSQAFRERWGGYDIEYRIVRSGGEVRWIESRSFISYATDGRPERVVGVNIDITERKLAEDQQRILVAELDHRVKNVLATVSAVAAHTLDTSPSMEHFVAALDGRIRSMAATHELLSQRQWRGIPLAELIQRELSPYANANNTKLDGPEVTLTAEAGQAMAMVFHELVTNAAKHGALSARKGSVSVWWRWLPNGKEGDRLVIEWRETGGSAVEAPSKSGHGTSVIGELIPHELGGTVDFELMADGARCKFEIPVKWLNSSQHDGTSDPKATSGAPGASRRSL
jgi:two-component sensor histidine kinase/integral membrane sensor domain MASE1